MGNTLLVIVICLLHLFLTLFISALLMKMHQRWLLDRCLGRENMRDYFCLVKKYKTMRKKVRELEEEQEDEWWKHLCAKNGIMPRTGSVRDFFLNRQPFDFQASKKREEEIAQTLKRARATMLSLRKREEMQFSELADKLIEHPHLFGTFFHLRL